MKKVTLVIEKDGHDYLGRVNFEDNLIVDSAKDLPSLEKKMKKLLWTFHKVDDDGVVFQYKYDLTALFHAFSFLKISNVAEKAGVNPSLLRQYVTGNKQASPTQAKKIEDTIHIIAKELARVEVYGPNEK